MDEQEWADLIGSFRVAVGWIQEDLADAAGLSLRTVQTIEAGGSVKPSSLAAVQDALGLPHTLAGADRLARLIDVASQGDADFGAEIVDRLDRLTELVVNLSEVVLAPTQTPSASERAEADFAWADPELTSPPARRDPNRSSAG